MFVFYCYAIKLDLHKSPTSIVDSEAKEKNTTDNTASTLLARNREQKQFKNDDDTESDYELNSESVIKPQKRKEEVKMKGVEKIRLDVPAILKDEGVPPNFVTNHHQVLAQLLTGKVNAATSSKSVGS